MSAFNIYLIKDLIHWIENNLEQPLSLKDVAKKSGYSKGYLLRIFHMHTGITLGYYIRSRRLYRVADELRLTKRPVLHIAMQYQFKSQQNFTQCFKAYFNITPAAYRYMIGKATLGSGTKETRYCNYCSQLR
ncbi:hypothetical protein CKG00_09230 [Morganella morganii]|uniref:HTH araC/xylS-type domain-containing protein n=1 Tax=Morganella morganii TaxID=582 RepID=A0A433ZWS0_MORMO|nr:hypothetical protein CKG00_09230 [Morganella morganii]